MNEKEEIIELWNTYSSQTDDITHKRQTINSFYLTIEIAILGFILTDFSKYGICLTIIGMIIACIWLMMIFNYRKLSQAKYSVLLNIEETLSIKPYNKEWEILKKKRYIGLTMIEIATALIFLLSFVSILFLVIFQIL
jgi:hypothetical protein